MSTTSAIPSEAKAAESIYTKATKAELSNNYNEAFKLYIQATESFLHLSRTTQYSETLQARWKTSAGKSLERAEKIKAFVHRIQQDVSDVSANDSVVRLAPVAINHFSSQEQYYVLKRGSRINQLSFPLWDDPLPPPSRSKFNDPDGQPPLSSDQQRVSAQWLRPSNIDTRITNTIHPQEILQHIVTDCSVCASISVCLEHARRFGSQLAREALHSSPVKEDHDGRYDIKMFVNGAWRRIVIDDALPFNPSDGSLMCMTINSQTKDENQKSTIYWPSLIEKSYMKLMGGYDFPGSNSSIDLHAITGWIPEQIDTKCPTFEREKTWERLISGFTAGKCLVTLGTGPKHDIHWRGTPLLSAHSYAVIDIQENEDNDRIFTVLDSWVQPEDEQRSRILRIPWSEVLYVFDGIYLSWDPAIWKHRIDFSGMWKRSGNETHEVDANHNLRITFTNTNTQTEDSPDEEIWLLLTRHIRQTTQQETKDFISLRAQLENPALSPPSTSSAITTATTASTTLLSSSNMLINQQYELSNTATYTNSTHYLVRMRISSKFRTGAIGVMACYEGEKESKEIGFSVSVYSGPNLQIAWDESVRPPPYSTRIEGTFTSKNCGGNCSYPTFMVNPQYHLRIHPSPPPTTSKIGGTSAGVIGSAAVKKSTTKVVLKAAKDVPVNVVVIWSKGDRKDELVEQEVAASSGAYTYGLAQLVKNFTPGDYSLIISTFEPHHTGPFTLQVECSTPFDLKSIPQEGAGMYMKTVKGEWDKDTAMGGPQFHRYVLNPRFELVLPTSGQVKIRLQLIKGGNNNISSTAFNVSMFNTTASTAFRNTPIATSGVYSETLAGVVTPSVTLSKGKYEIIPSTQIPGVQTGFRLIVYTSMSGVEVAKIR